MCEWGREKISAERARARATWHGRVPLRTRSAYSPAGSSARLEIACDDLAVSTSLEVSDSMHMSDELLELCDAQRGTRARVDIGALRAKIEEGEDDGAEVALAKL